MLDVGYVIIVLLLYRAGFMLLVCCNFDSYDEHDKYFSGRPAMAPQRRELNCDAVQTPERGETAGREGIVGGEMCWGGKNNTISAETKTSVTFQQVDRGRQAGREGGRSHLAPLSQGSPLDVKDCLEKLLRQPY